MSASLSALIPELVGPAQELVTLAGQAGFLPRVTSTLRSTAEQTRLYRRYQQGLQKYPVAPPGTSAHEYGYAFDLVTSPMQALEELGQVWEQAGGVWGGRYGDPVHFEYPGFKQAVQAPAATATRDPGAFNELVDVLLTFLPVVGIYIGAAELGGFILSFFPDWSDSDTAYYMQHPSLLVRLLLKLGVGL